jgi:hypothetical protein
MKIVVPALPEEVPAARPLDDLIESARKKTIYGTELIPPGLCKKPSDSCSMPDLIADDIAGDISDVTWDLFGD